MREERPRWGERREDQGERNGGKPRGRREWRENQGKGRREPAGQS